MTEHFSPGTSIVLILFPKNYRDPFKFHCQTYLPLMRPFCQFFRIYYLLLWYLVHKFQVIVNVTNLLSYVLLCVNSPDHMRSIIPHRVESGYDLNISLVSSVYCVVQKYATSLIEVEFRRMSLQEPIDELLPELHRRLIVEFACTLRHPRCVKEAKDLAYLLMSGVPVR